MKRCLQWLILLILTSSCEKAITFIPDQREPSLVVEATIENDQPPYVILSSSLDYFGAVSPELLQGSFVRDAVVRISNGTKSHTLKEYEQFVIPGHPVYYYSIDSSDLATAFAGELGGNYTLNITANGKEYSSVTSIPLLTKTIDSLYWQETPADDDSMSVKVLARLYDPPGLGNYVRYFTQTNDQPFLPGLNSVFDDQIIDGKKYAVEIEKGVNRNLDEIGGNPFFFKGDSVTIKLCNIEKPVFDFWRTMEYSYSSIGNPFSSPTKVMGNISGGALGYFGGYAAQYVSLVIPK